MDGCANPDGAEICGAADPLAGGGLSWKEKTRGPGELEKGERTALGQASW